MDSSIISIPSESQHTSEEPGSVIAQIGSSRYNLKNAVRLPIGEDPREWIAINIFDFHKQICMLFGTIRDYCTPANCSRMTAGKRFEFLWSCGPDQEAMALSATQYIQHIFDWVQEQLDDENVFPIKSEGKFPDKYMEICKTIVKRLFRVYAHIYHHHSDEVRNLKEEAHMNTSLKHFIYFIQEFNLVQPEEMDSLKDYINNLT